MNAISTVEIQEARQSNASGKINTSRVRKQELTK